MTTDDYTTPGWAELLKPNGYESELDDEGLHRAEMAANNVMDSVLGGMSAIGDLQWRACTNKDWDVDEQTFFALGVLQKEMADLVLSLRLIESNAIFARHQRELVKAKEPKS